MKTRTKKCGVFVALAAVLLVSAALVTSCPEALDFGGVKAPEVDPYADFVPPEGMGYIRLNVDVDKVAMRTATPTAPTYTLTGTNAFGKREVYITGGDAGSYNNLTWNGTDPITVGLTSTPYSVTIVGYNTAGTYAVAAGTGTVTVNAAVTGGKAVTIVMKEILDPTSTGATTGTLTLDLDDTFSVGAATANVVGLSSGATSIYNTAARNVLVATNVDFTLLPGYYRLELTLSKPDHATEVIREVIVIGSTLTTTYSRVLKLNPNVHTVTYKYHDNRTTGDGSKPFVHNTTLSHPGAGAGTAPVYLDNTDTPDTDWEFAGWFTAQTGGTQLVIGTAPILKSQIIHAQWAAAGATTGDIGWDVTISIGDDTPFTFTFVGSETGPISNINTYKLDPDDPENITVTVSNASNAAFTGLTFKWYVNNVQVGTGTSYTIPFTTNGDYLLEGTHTFVVEAETAGGVSQHSGHVEVHVDPTP